MCEPELSLFLADFGSTEKLQASRMIPTSMASTSGYVADIVENEKYGKLVDLLSLVATSYRVLCTYDPFKSEAMNDITEECRTEITFEQKYPIDLSDEAMDFIRMIRCLLKAKPEERSTTKVSLKPLPVGCY